MRSVAAFTLFLGCLAAGGCGGPVAPVGVSAAITNARVVDVSAGTVAEPRTLLIRDAAIAGIGDFRIPEGVRVLDAEGGYVIPGLRDMHAHQTWRYAGLYVAHGVTFVRDLWGSPARAADIAEARERGELVPDVRMAGNLIDGSPSFFPDADIVRSEAEAVALVDSLADAGVPFLKVYDALPEPAYDALVAAAAKRGLPVVGHVPMRISVRHAVRAGQRSIEHASNLLKGCSDAEPEILALSGEMLGSLERGAMPEALRAFIEIAGRLGRSYDPARCRELAGLLDANRTWVTPTLAAIRGTWFRNDPAVRDDPRSAYLLAETVASWPPEAGIARFFDAGAWAAGQATYEQARRVVRELADSGARILAGSDAGAPYVYPGSSLHDELTEIVAAGLSPARALRAATIDAAAFLGREGDPGTITVGARADLVVLGADPLADIGAVRDVRAVVLRGRVVDRDRLDDLLEEAKSAAARSRRTAG